MLIKKTIVIRPAKVLNFRLRKTDRLSNRNIAVAQRMVTGIVLGDENHEMLKIATRNDRKARLKTWKAPSKTTPLELRFAYVQCSAGAFVFLSRTSARLTPGSAQRHLDRCTRPGAQDEPVA